MMEVRFSTPTQTGPRDQASYTTGTRSLSWRYSGCGLALTLTPFITEAKERAELNLWSPSFGLNGLL